MLYTYPIFHVHVLYRILILTLSLSLSVSASCSLELYHGQDSAHANQEKGDRSYGFIGMKPNRCRVDAEMSWSCARYF